MDKNPSVEDVVGMCFFAFGVGASSQQPGIGVDLEVVQAMRSEYFEMVNRVASSWNRNMRQVLDSAGELGSRCARKAIEAKKKSVSISLDNYTEAKAGFQCPC